MKENLNLDTWAKKEQFFYEQGNALENADAFISTMEYVKSYCLEAEVIEFSIKFFLEGDEFEQAVLNALYEWDI